MKYAIREEESLESEHGRHGLNTKTAKDAKEISEGFTFNETFTKKSLLSFASYCVLMCLLWFISEEKRTLLPAKVRRQREKLQVGLALIT